MIKDAADHKPPLWAAGTRWLASSSIPFCLSGFTTAQKSKTLLPLISISCRLVHMSSWAEHYLVGVSVKQPVSHTPCMEHLGHPKHTSCYYKLHRARPTPTAVLCHPKARWVALWGPSIVWCIPPSVQSHWGGCHLLHTSAEGVESYLEPTRVSMHEHSPMGSWKFIHSWDMDAFEYHLGYLSSPTAVGMVHGRHRIPSTSGAGARHQLS